MSLETSTLSGWVGATAAALTPLVDALAAEIIRSDTLHVDDTPVPVLAPGNGKTTTRRLWVYVRDERPFGGRDRRQHCSATRPIARASIRGPT